ncbi:MAG: phenylacetate-CoA oxygenase subunit PaaJ [Acidimicrobiia bacterium]|nr:phenylacetate-CoA oxygenase subunit PaaJ [Acidimicrobiia bacterium]
MNTTSAHGEDLWAAVAAVPDPEMPPLTIEDLGMLRSIEADDGGAVTVVITPTYSGCPAVEYIEDQIVEALAATGVAPEAVTVRRELAPAWSTDWITDAGRAKLAASGISPPRSARTGSVPGETPVRLGPIICPRCGSSTTSEISRFGSTACKALYRCLDCSEPFDHVKEL